MNNGFEQSSMWLENSMPFTAFAYREDGFRLHWHHFIEMLYVVEGRYEIQVQQECLDCEKGDFVFINVDEPHLTRKKCKDSQMIVIHCDEELLYSTVFVGLEKYYHFAFRNRKLSFLRKVQIEEGGDLEKLLNDSYREYKNKESFYELCIQANILKIIVLYIRTYLSDMLEGRDDHQKGLEKLMPVLSYCSKNFMLPISQKTMADSVYLSTPYFSKLFKRIMGVTFVEYLNNLRIREAQRLIFTTDMSFINIAMEVGFGNVTYFNRVFKKSVGVTPGEYRRNNTKLSGDVANVRLNGASSLIK